MVPERLAEGRGVQPPLREGVRYILPLSTEKDEDWPCNERGLANSRILSARQHVQNPVTADDGMENHFFPILLRHASDNLRLFPEGMAFHHVQETICLLGRTDSD